MSYEVAFVSKYEFIHWLARGWDYVDDMHDIIHGEWSIIMRRDG